MTPHFHLRSPSARRPATSSDVSALPGQDVSGVLRSRLAEKAGRTTLLVILHYLLKNNITFMWENLQGKSGGVHYLQSLYHQRDPPHRLEAW